MSRLIALLALLPPLIYLDLREHKCFDAGLSVFIFTLCCLTIWSDRRKTLEAVRG